MSLLVFLLVPAGRCAWGGPISGQHLFLITVCFMMVSTVSKISPDRRRMKGHLKDWEVLYQLSRWVRHKASKGESTASTDGERNVGDGMAVVFGSGRKEVLCAASVSSIPIGGALNDAS